MLPPLHSTRAVVSMPGAHHRASTWHTLQPRGSPTEKGLWLGRERGMDTYGLQGHPLPASRQGPLSIQVPLDPSGRVNCLRAEREMQERKTSRASRKHAAHPSPTTYDQTDSRDRLAALSSPVRPPGTSPTARRSPCRLPSRFQPPGTRQGTPAGQRSPCSGWQ